jgi:hypothetical protein
MAIELKHLQIIYGIDGARAKWEQMCSLLIKGEHPDSRSIRVYKGDGGVDQSVGDWDGHSPVKVFQQKYFPDRIGESQKKEIRRSCKTAKGNSNFTLEKWVLCIPINFSPDEKRWWDEWKAKQDPTGQVIQLWAADDIERLLMDPKNKGIKEEFFRQEHLTQIREMHQVVVGQGGSDAEEDAARFAWERAGWSGRAVDQARQRGHWELVIRPVRFEERRVPSLADLRPLLKAAAVKLPRSNWNLPVDVNNAVRAGSGICQDDINEFAPRAWCFYRSGQFCHIWGNLYDWNGIHDSRRIGDEAWREMFENPVIRKPFGLEWVLSMFTHMYYFASRLAASGLFKEGDVCIENRVVGLGGRYLAEEHMPKREFGPAGEDQYYDPEQISPSHLIVGHRELALSAARELFLQFSLDTNILLPDDYLQSLQPTWEAAFPGLQPHE